MTAKIPANSHVSYLDSIRGLAALTVVSCHYVESHELPCRSAFCDYLLARTPLHFWWDGRAAVILFFVLSGLVLSLRYFQHARPPVFSGVYWVRYFITRIFRIWPPYLVVLGIAALIYQYYQSIIPHIPGTVPSQNDWIPTLWGQPAGWDEFWSDSLLLGIRMDMLYLPQAWTLSIELTLSLLVPIGVWLAFRHALWLVALGVVAVVGLGASQFLIQFMFGVLLAQHHQKLSSWLVSATFYRRCTLALGLILFTMAGSLEGIVRGDGLNYGIGIGASLLLLVAFSSARLQKILLLPWLHHIGRVSYSIYLVHFLVLINVTPWFLAWANRWSDEFYGMWWLGLLMNILVSILVATVSYRWLEIPSIALGGKLKHYLDERAGMAG